jgi:hypothetical protein
VRQDKGITRARYPSTRGKKVFHVRFIRRSYRIRGRVPRIQINAKAIINEIKVWIKSIDGGAKEVGINKAVVKTLIMIILAYSAIKIKAKLPLLYSILNPDTSSDSPSAKSKGVRFVSAKVVINQVTNIGNMTRRGHVTCPCRIMLKLKDMTTQRAVRRIRDILTSYEIVCATPRRAPRRAYLEFDDHPAARVV